MSKDAVPNDLIEERLRQVIIGEIERQTIVVADYNPGWPERFRHEEARIRAALGGACSRWSTLDPPRCRGSRRSP
jgi:hypothetical protein